jgi:arylsulfatase A-like enzyme
MNVLLLSADSLRVDRTSLFDHERETTPFLAEAAADGFDFRRAYANGRNTAASFPAVHTSRHADAYDGLGIPATGPPTLAEALSEAGYRTHAIHTNELVAADYNYDRGFDVYRDARGGSRGEDGGNRGWRGVAREVIGDGIAFEAAKRAHFLSTEYLGVKLFDTADAVSGFEDDVVGWTTAADGDWFVWAHYMNPHHPYEPPTECQEALGLDPVPRRRATRLSRKMRLHPGEVTPGERKTLAELYDAAVLSWDREVEATVEALEAAGELEDTLVVLTADHGELLGEGGRYGHPPVLDQPLLRVPLVFLGGSVEPGRSGARVGLVDLAPTLLRLAGVGVPDACWGRALFDADGTLAVEDRDRTQFCETGDDDADAICAVGGDHKLAHDRTGGDYEPFTLDSAELTETSVTGEDGDGAVADLREALADHEERAAAARVDAARVDEEALREDLAALGYLDG